MWDKSIKKISCNVEKLKVTSYVSQNDIWLITYSTCTKWICTICESKSVTFCSKFETRQMKWMNQNMHQSFCQNRTTSDIFSVVAFRLFYFKMQSFSNICENRLLFIILFFRNLERRISMVMTRLWFYFYNHTQTRRHHMNARWKCLYLQAKSVKSQ